MKLNYNGQVYDIVNWDEFTEKLLKGIGFMTENAIVDQINYSQLVDLGGFKRSISHKVDKNILTITSNVPYAIYLEYGTAGTKKGIIDPFGEYSQPPNPNRLMPVELKNEEWQLKGGLKDWAKRHGFQDKNYFLLAKHIQEYGMKPHAPFRKVLYNKSKMKSIITKGVRIAAK